MEKQNELLWKLQYNFITEFEKRCNKIYDNDLTVRELLDLGFNNNYLILSNEKFKRFELGYKDEDGTYSNELTDEQMNTIVEYYRDSLDYDDYVIMLVKCKNIDDEKLFKEEK